MDEFQIITAVPLLVLLAIATLIDWREHSIPNALSLGGALFGFILQASMNGPIGLVVAASGWGLCLVCFLPFYMSGGMAAGDVKLMAAVGAFLGPIGGISACVCTLVVGALIGLVCLGYESLLRSSGSGSHASPAAALRSGLRARIPYAGAIAAGTAVSLISGGVLADLSRLASEIAHNGVFA